MSAQVDTGIRVPRLEAWLGAALLFIILGAVNYDVIFQGRSLVLTDHYNPLDYRPLPQNYGDEFVRPDVWARRNLVSYANIRDAGGPWWQWGPDGQFLHRAMELGEWPFWDPYVGAGAPAMANMTPGYFFPPYTAVVALGASVPLQNAYFLTLMWAAGFFTFLFLRLHGLAFVSALAGGVVVLMSGGLNQHIGTITPQAALGLPVSLYATRLFLDAPTRTRSLAMAAVYAAFALASFPPVLLWVFGITAFYVVVATVLRDGVGESGSRSVPGRPTTPSGAQRLRLGLRWAVIAMLSVGLVSFYYVPAMMLREAVPYVLAFYKNAGLESMPLVNVYQLLSPTLMGGVMIYAVPPIPTSNAPNIPYVGVVALIAMLLARPAPGSRARIAFYTSAIAAFVILMKLLGLPPVQWAGQLPLLNQIHFAHYWGISLSFLIAFLAALGVDSLLRGTTTLRRALLTITVALVVTESLWWAVLQRFEVLKSPSDIFWIRDWRVLKIITVSATVALLIGVLRESLRRTAAATLLVLVAAEGLFNNTYPSPKAWDIFAHPVPYVQLLKSQAGMERVLPFGALNANLNSAFEIFSFDSLMTINPPRAYELYHRYTEPPYWLFLREAKRIPPDPVLDRANIGLLVIRDAFPDLVREAQARAYAVKFNDGYVWIFKRPTPPRFFFSSDYRVLDTAAVLNAIAQAPSREILIEEPPGFPTTPNSPGDPQVLIESYHRNSHTLIVDAPRPGLVYASESFFEGWTASVNGKLMPILPANYAFRAVAVPTGRSRIEFRYWPPGLTAGLVLSILSVALLVAFAAATTRPATQHKDHAFVPVSENERLNGPESLNSQSGSASTGIGTPESRRSAN